MRSGAALTALVVGLASLSPRSLASTIGPALDLRLDLRLDRLGAEDGLSHGAIQALAQDRDGFIWIGTPAGLDRWDGYEAVHHELRLPDGSVASSVTALLVDREDRLWVGTTAGLVTLDRATGAATPWALHGVGEGAPVRALHEDGRGRLLAAAGPRLFAREAPGFTEISFERPPDEDPRGAITSMAEGPDGTVLALLRELKPPRSTLIRLGSDGGPVTLVRPPGEWGFAEGVHVDARGRVWLDPWHVADPAGGGDLAWRRLEGGDETILPSRACEGPEGWLWFAASDGLYVRIEGDPEPHRVRPDPANWQQNTLLSCVVDRGGGVWLGSLGGLFRWHPYRKPFRHVRHDPADPGSMSGDPVSSLVEGEDGSLWVGIYGGGLNRLDADGRATRHRHADGDPSSLCDDRVWALARGPGGVLWIGTESGLCRLSPGDAGFSRVGVPGLPGGTEGARLKVIAPQRDGVLWLGTNVGLYRFDPETGDGRTYHQAPEPRGLASRQVGDLLLEEPGALWIASTDGDVQRLDLRAGTFRHHRLSSPDGRPIPRAAIYDLERDGAGTLWAATQNGLARLDEERGRLALVLPGDRLPGPIVYSVLAGTGGLWLGTSRGLARVDPDAPGGPSVRAFDRADGVGSIELNRHAALRLAGGTLAFGGMSGLTTFRPERIRDDPVGPPLALTSVRVLGDDGERSLPTHGLDRIELDHRDHALTIEMAALAYARPEKCRYAYRLAGFDRDWIDAGTRRYVRYTNLPAGAYALELKAANQDGVWNDRGLTLPILVRPPFWETWWFRAGMVALLGGALTLAYQLRIRHLRALEGMRLRIAGDLHDELGSDLSGIALAASLLRPQAHFTERDRERLGQVEATSLRVLQALRDIVWYINPEHDTWGSLAARVRSDAASLLGEREARVTVDIADGDAPIPMDLRRHLLLACKETLHNVARHAGDCSVTVRLTVRGDRFDLEVADDGRGFDPSSAQGGSGLGSLRRRAARMGGALEIESRPGGGTRVRIHRS